MKSVHQPLPERNKAAGLRERFRRLIVSGQWPPGESVPPRRQLAADFGVSLMTVQRAMDDLQQDGFVTSPSTSGTSVVEHPPHLHRFGLLAIRPNGTTDQLSMFHQALEIAARNLSEGDGSDVQVYPLNPAPRYSPVYDALEADVLRHRVGGLIFVCSPSLLEHTPIVKEPDLPRVALMGTRGSSLGLPRITYDQRDFYRRAFEWCRQTGYRRPACLVFVTDREQLVTCQEEAAGIGYALPPHRLLVADPRNSWSGSHLVQALWMLTPQERPDCLVVADDHLAEPVATGLYAAQVRVPEELAVLCHANFPSPPVSALPFVRLGFDSRELLQHSLASLQGQQRGEQVPSVLMVPARFEDELPGL